jgi:hypothetical protein
MTFARVSLAGLLLAGTSSGRQTAAGKCVVLISLTPYLSLTSQISIRISLLLRTAFLLRPAGLRILCTQ